MRYSTNLARLKHHHQNDLDAYHVIAGYVGNDAEKDIDLLTVLALTDIENCIWSMRAVNGGRELAIEFSILVSYPFGNDSWKAWAKKWLSGEDRSFASANKAHLSCCAVGTRFFSAPFITAQMAGNGYCGNAKNGEEAAGMASQYAWDVSRHAMCHADSKDIERLRQLQILNSLLDDAKDGTSGMTNPTKFKL